jgi:hypothetical protein
MTAPLPKGEHIYKVFHCYGCQTCFELTEDEQLIQHHHILSQEDITEEIAALYTQHNEDVVLLKELVVTQRGQMTAKIIKRLEKE